MRGIGVHSGSTAYVIAGSCIVLIDDVMVTDTTEATSTLYLIGMSAARVAILVAVRVVRNG